MATVTARRRTVVTDRAASGAAAPRKADECAMLLRGALLPFEHRTHRRTLPTVLLLVEAVRLRESRRGTPPDDSAPTGKSTVVTLGSMEVIFMEVKRSPEWESLRAKQRGLIEELRDRYPDAEISEGEHIERADGGWRSIPIVVVEFSNGDQVTFFAEKPEHPMAEQELIGTLMSRVGLRENLAGELPQRG